MIPPMRPTPHAPRRDLGLTALLALAGSGCEPLDDFTIPPPCDGDDCFVPAGPEGCADGAREGFESLAAYPYIAACAGAWSVGGVLRVDLAPTCNRGGGDDSAHADGQGCSSVDLCAEGWEVCAGADEVAALSPDGCVGAVPAGTPDKSLFFVAAQHSRGSNLCDPAQGDDDVFGCGNLGLAVTPTQECGTLNRFLGSAVLGSCGYNEAEPPIGPWQCGGAADAAQHEGRYLAKAGCPNQSCSYGGSPVGSSDRGGVLCCRTRR
jgi:hypothetical protein